MTGPGPAVAGKETTKEETGQLHAWEEQPSTDCLGQAFAKGARLMTVKEPQRT